MEDRKFLDTLVFNGRRQEIAKSIITNVAVP